MTVLELMDEERIDVPSSDEESPSEEESATEESAGEESPTAEEEELFELPDGRMVDAVTLQTEWKENFAPEFTRRSQELAELKKSQELKAETPAEPSPYADPDYVPESYEEILKVAEQRVFEAMERRDAESRQLQQQAEKAVIEQLDAVKKVDPKVDENKLFLHANKYGFRDLSQAYENMRDMNMLTKTVQKNTAANIQRRNDPVSINSSGSVGSAPDPSMFESATEYLRSLKN